MKRKTFDFVLTAGGAVLTIVLVVAGVLLVWGANFANNDVHNQLAKQDISFPPLVAFQHPTGKEVRATMRPYLEQYAGQQVLTGKQAEAYADHFIAIHLSEMTYGGVYSKVSAASMKNPTTAKLAAEVQTTFRGTTLRGLLLEAYGFSVFGEIAGIAAVLAFIFGGIMLILTLLGLLHYRRVDYDVEFPKHDAGKAAD
jgi:hypothetical protein